MAKEVMRRTAADNPYLHKDFHGALSAGIEYLHERYGADAVRDYLRQFASTYYAPLKAAVCERGLVAMNEYLEHMYATEGGDIRLNCSGDELVFEVAACPAVTHMHEHGYRVARLWPETTRAVYEAICESTPFAVEVLEYDDATGGTRVRFYRREQ
jgi:hypothetical protein